MTETTEEKFIFSSEQLIYYPKVLDGIVNFKKIFGKVKLFFFIKFDLGKFAEENDRAAWTKLLKLINSMYAKGKISEELGVIIKEIFAQIEGKDENAFITYLSKMVAQNVKILDSDSKEEIIIKSILILVSQLDADFLDDLNTEFDELAALADEQDA